VFEMFIENQPFETWSKWRSA